MKLKHVTCKAQIILLFILLILPLVVWKPSLAQDFIATTIGDFGNVTVMEVTGNYDAKNPDGSINSAVRQVIAKEFFRTHKDTCDFLVIFSNFDFQMPDPEARAFYHSVKNDVQGIGFPIFDNSSFFGSDGKLQGIIDMGNVSKIAVDPLDPKFEETLFTLSHEQMHRWGAYVKFKDTSGNPSTGLLGKDGTHWSFLLDSSASILYGNKWKSNGDGSFTSVDARKYYSPLDLYLMGIYDESQVPPMLLIDNPSIDPGGLPEVGVTISGTPHYISIDNIIAAEGARIPGPAGAQRSFRTAFILITAPNTFTGDELYGVETIRSGWASLFSILTDGQGFVHVASTSKEDLPTNPGVPTPPVTPRTAPPSIDDAVKWLVNNQGSDGSWMDLPQTREKDTSETVLVLKNFSSSQESYTKGLQWLKVTSSGNMDYLSRKIEVLISLGQDATALLSELLSRQNADGGWGSDKNYMSNPTDTSFALKALALSGYGDSAILSKAIAYLKSKQNANGGWGSEDEESSIQAMTNVLFAFNKYKAAYALDEMISQGVAWLLQRQNPDGGFGNSPSTVYETAIAALTLKELGVSRESIGMALSYILSLQSANGSWYESSYQTALAVNAVWKATVDPDLSIKPDDITFTPQTVTTLPSSIAINAIIWNLGKTDVPQAKVALYDGALSEGKRIGEQMLAFPGQTSVLATFSVTIADGNEHQFYVSIDPENLIKESDKSNNLASKILYPEPTYDFEAVSISTSPNPVNIFQYVRIASRITNNGTKNAYYVNVRYYIDDAGGPVDLATVTVDIPANSTITNEITWRANKAGENLKVTVLVDPFNAFTELSKTNNKASTYLTVNGSTESAYDFEAVSILASPNPANILDSVKITSRIANKGVMDAYNVQVRYYIDDAAGPIDLATVTVDIPANSTITNEITWRANKAGQNLKLVVLVDPFDVFTEFSKTNNKAFAYLTVNGSTDPNLKISYQDIVITPSPAREGGNANISALVENDGFSSASNIGVAFYRGVPGADGVLLGSQVISSLNAGEGKRTSIDWTNIPESGERIITIQVDPSNSIKEIKKDDNSAFTTLKILSLPDLAISTNSITFTPPAPKEGDLVSIRVSVQNKGEQEASNVVVKAYEKGTAIGSQTISSVLGLSQGTASFVYDTTGKKGSHQIDVIVDPDQAILEQSKDNNKASRTFGAQNANLWLTEPYISPNGDGVKDSTEFFFKLDTAQTVKVVVVNREGKSVRSFSGGELKNATSGNITWDGLNDDGMVVSDGPYQIQIISMNDAIFGSLLVTVDTNRSPLTEAIGTEYLLNNNLTCMLPDIVDWSSYYPDFRDWVWFPDESGILVNIAYPDINTPEYRTGLYTATPDGEDILRSIPWEWSQGIDPTNDYYVGGQYRNSRGFAISPTGKKFAFILEKYNKRLWETESQLWVADADGKNLTLLDSWHYRSGGYIEDLKWSPDGEFIVYFVRGLGTGFWLLATKADGTEKDAVGIPSHWESIPDGMEVDFSSLKWSPDSTKLAFVFRYFYYGNDTPKYFQRLVVSNVWGMWNEVFVDEDYIDYQDNIKFFDWLNNEKIVLSETGHSYWGGGGALWLVDVPPWYMMWSSNGYLIYGDSEEVVISPDKKKIALISDTVGGFYVKVFDLVHHAGEWWEDWWEFKESTLYESPTLPYWWFKNLRDLRWSQDGTKLAFVDHTYKKIDDCQYQGHVVVLDVKTGDKKAFALSDKKNPCIRTMSGLTEKGPSIQPNITVLTEDYVNGSLQWLPDHITLIGQDFSGIFAINSEREEKKYPIVEGKIKELSPRGRYLAYEKQADRSTVCYGHGSVDLWAMSSALNLTANLRVSKDKSAVILKGTAVDLNFEGYQLEYTDAKSPTVWNLIGPPSEVPVFDDVFTTWVPPYEGTFYVKLTVWDKAGNTAWDRKRVSWGLSSTITNLYKSLEIFSPNGDGIKDSFELHYTVLEPVHLEFNVYDEKNNLERTFLRDYPSPTNDFIVWDGKDETGRMVPDGKYKVKVFDYEFFVEVDNTPPDVAIALSKIHLDSEAQADLVGHVFDEKLKSWIIEYGEGENPEQWFEYMKGKDFLAKTDPDGNPILPAQDIVVETYGEREIAWLVGKKLRITGEDFAGNKRTAVSDFLEEVFVLNEWDHRYVSEIIPGGLARPGVHLLGGLATIRVPLMEMKVQYWIDRHWSDGPDVTNASSGSFLLEWDNSGLSLLEGFAVRIKATDLFGAEYYSNVLSTGDLFGMAGSCDLAAPVEAENSLLENLRSLQFQVRSDQDSRYLNWTDYAIWDATAGDWIPVGRFVPPLPSIQTGMRYVLRMIGIGVSGKMYQSDDAVYPPNCPVKLSLNVTYYQADCESTSGRAILSAEAKGLDAYRSARTLSYYIQRSGEFQLLGQPTELGPISVDTSQMAEGSYPIKAVLTYFDLDENTIKEASASASLLVDRVLPTGQITYPGKSLTICPITMADPKGNWYGIGVEAIASDDRQVKGYELYYGVGENPVQWLPATSRRDGKSSLIAGAGTVKGRIGVWDISGLNGTAYSLKLKITDIAGNTSCVTTSFSVDHVVEIPVLVTDKSLFSPNGDEILERVQINYEVDEYAKVDVKVFKLIEEDGSYSLGPTPVRTILSGFQHLAGAEQAEWDGQDDSKMAVPDGHYGIAVFATDSCGNTNMRWASVEVDNTPPVTIITYPRPGDPIGNIVEVKGTVDDLHFQSYSLEVGEGDSPDTWGPLSSGTTPIKNGILGGWNTYGLEGRWTLRVTATDAVGNKGIASVAIDLGVRKDLIKSLAATPNLFSPNNDGKLDTVSIRYELADQCGVKIDVLDGSGLSRKTYTGAASGVNVYVWDGKADSGTTVPDGVYTIKLTSALVSNPSVTQEESITVGVDSTPPLIEIKQPLNNSFFKDDILVGGTIADPNLFEYSIAYTGDSGTVLLDRASVNRENYTFGVLRDLPEGDYTLTTKAKDLAENSMERRIVFGVDRTPPQVRLDHPKEGEYYGSGKNVVDITGAVVEKNLDLYRVRYGSGDNPTQWIDLVTGNTVPITPQLFSWKVGKEDAVPDGLYTLSFFTKDKAGLTGEAKIKVTVDNTPPETAITSPRDGDYVRAATEIKGTAFDLNLEKYILEVGNGQCASAAANWVLIKTATTPIKEGLMAPWSTLPADGDYCLRLTAGDRVGNRSEAKVSVKVDTHPPAAPRLSGSIENRSNAKLTWTANMELDLAGYILYRNGQNVNTSPMKDIGYLDSDLKEGVYTYTVKAIDLAGNESLMSNQVKLTVDLKGPEARISSPKDGSKVSGLVNIKGTAYSADDFKQYRISVGQGSTPAAWSVIRTSPVATSFASLAQWDTLGLSEGAYSIKLEAEDLSGNVSTSQVVVTVDNISPSAPVLLSAVANGSDVTLAWKVNTEPDLAGYLLFRNEQIANAPGVVIGDLQPYLISGTTYLDKSVPDGKFKYYLAAMDQAGNMSGPSNAIEVDIDSHSPRATIVEPSDKSKFQEKILVRAECSDIDLASVQFQYKKASEIPWINLGNYVTNVPYVTSIDPTSLGLTYGDYHLRAVATDKGGKTDSSPPFITVTYKDLKPPDGPKDLKAITNGRDVTLTWTANTEADLNGYNIYRKSGGLKVKVNSSLQKETFYQDKNLSDGTYTYEVTALDTYDNESLPSNSVSVKIYGLYLGQPYTPTGEQVIQISGYNAAVASSVEIFNGTSSAGKVNADSNGYFGLPKLDLVLGENRITAKATDSAGNVSRSSDVIVIVYNEAPAAPTGLIGSVNGFDVSLTWNPNTESDLSGYNLYQDGEKVNAPVSMTTGDVNASCFDADYLPSKAFDSDPSTYWRCTSSYSDLTVYPLWWEVDLPSPELINRMEIEWADETDNGGNVRRYAGKDFVIHVWSGYAWITQKIVSGNNEKSNSIDFKPSYRTDKIRIFITDVTAPYSIKEVRISEVRLFRDNLLMGTTYGDTGLANGFHRYEITAVDYYGFESLPSEEAKAGVGDVTPPSAPQDLAATASGADILLDWKANSEADLSGYNLYKNTLQGWVKINLSLINGTSYRDANLKNGKYTYRVTAVDSSGNESLPSNEAAASVSTEPPQPPINLQIVSSPEGRALSASWSGSGIPAGYNLYRGAVPGGPYARVNGSSIIGTSYLDRGLTNGFTYYYVVVAVDSFGNESGYSNEAMGVPSDMIPPLKPELFFPTQSGKPISLFKDRSDISGLAEPGSTVELFRNGMPLGKTTALQGDVTQNFSLDCTEEGLSVSPDGKTAACTDYYGHLVLLPLPTGATRWVGQGRSPLWSPDGTRLAYLFTDSDSNDRIGIYDLEKSESASLTNDAQVVEGNPSWTSDGKTIAFISNRGGPSSVWIMSLLSGSLSPVTLGGNPSHPKISPDGKKLAYFDDNSLYLTDMARQTTIQVDSQADGSTLDWSPGSERLAFASKRNGNLDIFILGVESQNQAQITGSVDDELNPVWSPDGKQVLFVRRDVYGNSSLWVISTETPGQERLLNQNVYDLGPVIWTKCGEVFYIDLYELNRLDLEGAFRFSDISLDPGDNLFHAAATDASGNASPASDQILVAFDTGLIPDLEVNGDGILINPPSPIAGEEVSIKVAVKNRGRSNVGGVDTEIYLQGPDGKVELIKSETIPSIAGQSEEWVEIRLDTRARSGSYKIVAMVDPEDKIKELSEINNFASKEFFIATGEGIFMATTLNSTQYQSDQDVNVNVNLRNSGFEREIVLEAGIEDQNGTTVSLLGTMQATLPYASEKNYRFVWNTGSTYAGSYRVHALLKGGSDVMAENISPFTILTDRKIDATVLTDKVHYSANENVAVTLNIKNNGRNDAIPSLKTKIRILDSSNGELFKEDKEISNLFPGTTVALNLTWNAGLHPPGDYTIVADIYLNSQSILTKSAGFKIDPSLIITGNTTVVPSVVFLGNAASAAYSIQNAGNVDVSALTVSISITDLETQTLMESHEEIIDLPMNSFQAGQFTFSTQGYGLKSYGVLFRYTLEGVQKSIASTSFTVKDGTPPVVSILSPNPDGRFASAVDIAVLATDNASGIARVEYLIDGGPWMLLPASDPFQGRYSAIWTPTTSDNGIHAVSVRAYDGSGNASVPVSVTFTIDLTNLPPVANAGPDQNVVTGTLVTLNGKGSYDPEGVLITFLWSFLEVPSGSLVRNTSFSDVTSAKPEFIPDVDGTYRIKLVVNDGVQDSLPDEVVISAATPNVPPNADAGPDQNVFTGATVSLDGSRSKDPDNGPSPLNYLWGFATKPAGSLLTDDAIVNRNLCFASFIPDVSGVYELKLTVSDGDLSSEGIVQVTATTPNVPPNANAGEDITLWLGEEAVLDGSRSNDPDNGPQPLSYTWRFVTVPAGSQIGNGDIRDADKPRPWFKPDVEGTYVLELRVSDSASEAYDNVAVTARILQIPPTSTATLSPLPNASGWNKSNVTVTLTATDNSGSGVQAITYAASGAQIFPNTTVAGAVASLVISAEGRTIVTFFATDNGGNIETPKSIVVNIDKTAPNISCSASPNLLWPPNHKMVAITVSVNLSDPGSGAAGFKLVSVTSNEPDNGLGDGDTANDIQGWSVGTADTSGQLRAERSGKGTGRRYTLTYEAEDVAGNRNTCITTVVVPHDKGK